MVQQKLFSDLYPAISAKSFFPCIDLINFNALVDIFLFELVIKSVSRAQVYV